jgi:hypothetical protein
MPSILTGPNRDKRSRAVVLLMLIVLFSIAVSAVTRFVDFSSSPITWTHAQTTQGHRAYYTPERIGAAAPSISFFIIPSQALFVQQLLPSQPFPHNLYNRPPPEV